MKNLNDEHFVHMDSTKKVLQLALATHKNLILYGPGGYGKTAIIKHTLEELNIPYNKVIGYNGMAPEKLMGLPNFKKLEEESEYEIAFEKSPFTGAKVLVLEEFMDVAPETSAAFKDIISAKGYTYKQTFIPSDIEVVIITSNKNPLKMDMDDSLKAFYNERFILQQEVNWPIKSADMYSDLLKLNTHANDETIELLSFLYTKANVSPRVALDATDIYINNEDLTLLRFIPAFKDLDLVKFEDSLKQKQSIVKFTSSLHGILELATRHENDLGVLIYLRDTLAVKVVNVDIAEERGMALVTVKNSINIKHLSILNNLKY